MERKITLNLCPKIDLSVARNGGCFIAIFVTLKDQSRTVLHIHFHNPLRDKYLADT